ncbi:MAG: GGDEF domain-containing protein [Eubacteriales bacterium]|nr:GGDEF domain-containing protein [Eubacteriales bacterium]
MAQRKNPVAAREKDTLSAERWCRYLVKACYVAIIVNLAVLIAVWHLFSFGQPGVDQGAYWINFIILPSALMLLANATADLLVRSRRIAIAVKEYVALLLILLLCAAVTFIHRIAAVLLASFIIPVLVSALFSNLRMTSVIYALSQGLLILGAVNMHHTSTRVFEQWIWLEALAASGLLSAAYLLARVLAQYGAASILVIRSITHDNLTLEEKLDLDPLTGLYNRRAYDQALPRLIKESRQDQAPLTIVALDIDDFKRANDVYGHAAGDRVLLMLTEILRQEAPENSKLFRIGGDEFILLFRDYTVDEAVIVCRGLLSIAQGACLPSAKGLELSFSCGIAGLSGELNEPDKLFQAADAALYLAKNHGKKRIFVHEDKALAPVSARNAGGR